MHIIYWCNNYIPGANNGSNNPVYSAHKNVDAHCAQERSTHDKVWQVCTQKMICHNLGYPNSYATGVLFWLFLIIISPP